MCTYFDRTRVPDALATLERSGMLTPVVLAGQEFNLPREDEPYYGDFRRGWIVQYTTNSRYSGSLVEEANRKALQADFPSLVDRWILDVYYDYSGAGLAVRAEPDFSGLSLSERRDLVRTMRDFLTTVSALADYPVVDEAAWSELEAARTDEAWQDYGRADFRRELESHGVDLENVEDETLDSVFVDALSDGSQQFTHAEHNSVYIDAERLAVWAIGVRHFSPSPE